MILEQFCAELLMRLVPILHFLSGFIGYLIITIAGSIVNTYIHIFIEKKKRYTFTDVIIFAIIPAVIITSLESLLIPIIENAGIDGEACMIGIAFLLGVLDDDITMILSSATNLVKTYNFIVRFIGSIRKGKPVDLDDFDFLDKDDRNKSVNIDEDPKKSDKDTK